MAAAAGEEAASSHDLVEILDQLSPTPIDISRYVGHVRNPAAGAIATFEGTTRDNFEGKTVLELRYEAYVPMALRCLQAICVAARRSWVLSRLAVVHRLGVVPVGEASVFVAASAVHRADALEACRFVIDEIKASVPIWKKEVYDNGEVWKENAEFLQRRAEGAHSKGSSCCGHKVRVLEPAAAQERPQADPGAAAPEEGGADPGRPMQIRRAEEHPF